MIKNAPAGIPQNVNISGMSASATIISWMRSENAKSYKVYYSNSKFGTYTLAATVNAPAVSYSDNTQGLEGKLSKAHYYRVTAVNSDGTETDKSDFVSRETDFFGPGVILYSPADDANRLLAETSEIFRPAAPEDYIGGTEWGQFSSLRFAFLFKPGIYNWDDNAAEELDGIDSARLKIGFYTHVAGLGELPSDTVVPKIYVTAEWLGTTKDIGELSDIKGNCTCNFWRTIENITLDSDTMWGVSQASPLRRLLINGSLALATSYPGLGNWASGGFLADSVINGNISYNSQQQWFSRNTKAGGSSGGQWNIVHVGVEDANNMLNKTQARYTGIEQSPTIQEKPFLYIDAVGDYKVFVPGLRRNAAGPSWNASCNSTYEGLGPGVNNEKMGSGISLDLLNDFYTVKLSDSISIINEALAAGKNLLFTPGVYCLSETLRITKAGTVVLGIGLATLSNEGNFPIMTIGDVDGVKVSGLIFDAGPTGAPVLLRVGEDKKAAADSNNPILLQDMFFRVGGDEIGKADVSVEINRRYTIADDFWVWRADHGKEVSWSKNTTKNGLVVNGDDVTVYALMCEHFHEYQTQWNGERGRLYFYQSELPYDVESQSEWAPSDSRTLGYASYKVSDNVEIHEAWGLGVYSCPSRTGPGQNGSAYIVLDNAIEIPEKAGVKIHNACTLNLVNPNNLYSGENMPSIKNIVNKTGGPVWGIIAERKYITHNDLNS